MINNPPQTLQRLQLPLLQILESFSAILIALLPCQEETASQPIILLEINLMESNHTMVSRKF